MRVIHAFFIVSTLLFVTGIGFVIAGARASREAPSAATSASSGPALTPVASVKQIMRGIVVPAARLVFASVGSTLTIEAASLIESANLMLMNGRAIDRDRWAKYCQDMIKSSQLVLDAVAARNPQGVFDASGTIYEACNDCHQTYMR
jgi:hypothetical protein